MENELIDPMGKLLAVLFTAFPSGMSSEKRSLYFQQVQAGNFDLRDVGEAVNRIIHAQDRLPPNGLPLILRTIREAAADRAKARDEALRLETGGERFDSAASEYIRVQRDLGSRGLFWCGVEQRFIEGICSDVVEIFDETGARIGESVGTRCVDPTPSLEQCRDELDRCVAAGINPKPPRMKPIKGFSTIEDALREAV